MRAEEVSGVDGTQTHSAGLGGGGHYTLWVKTCVLCHSRRRCHTSRLRSATMVSACRGHVGAAEGSGDTEGEGFVGVEFDLVLLSLGGVQRFIGESRSTIPGPLATAGPGGS